MQQFGDNIYHHGPDGEWIQENSRHSKDDGSPEARHIGRDTKSERVLLGEEFVYFGGGGPVIPASLRNDYSFDLVHDRPAYRCNFTDEQVAATVEWVRSHESGVQGRPHDWARRPQRIERVA
jgi:Nucleotide modification associated domain 2